MIPAVLDERRKYSRVSAGLHVAFCLNGDILSTTTENISIGGMRILAPPTMPSGKVFDFIITLKGEPVETRGRVVHVSHDGIHVGIQFERALRHDWGSSAKSSKEISLDAEYFSEEIKFE
ncbi:MAG: hypothetical protein GTN81_09895 [Proteobacteria bacterium]|nr:hypothetical protein [Pseudomonadota bacterium]